jgi:hypothetical protein
LGLSGPAPLTIAVGRIDMKSLALVSIGCCVALSGAVCGGSEILRTLEQKVASSDLVAVGVVTDVQLGEIRQLRNLSLKTQDTRIRFRVEECILGKEDGEISIEAHSVHFTDSDGAIQGATAGFSNYGVQKGGRFIAYLRKTKGGYILSGESNQYLEWIDDKSHTVRDVGQTGRMVALELKRKELLRIAQKAQPDGAASGSQPIRSETNSTSSAAGSRR